MDAPFFHPKLVHVPIALGVLMPLVASALALAWWRGWLPRRVWVLAIGLQAVLLGSGVLALRSGEADEDRVERIVSEQYIERHEASAQAFVWASGAVLALMLVAGGMGSRRAGLPVAALAAVGTLVVLALGYRAGQGGGDLVYRHGAAQAYTNSSPVSGSAGEPSRGSEDDD